MSLFRYAENISEDENHTEAQIQKKRIRMKLNHSENDPVFKGKTNLALEDLKEGIDSENHELWVVKLPKNFRAERMEGQEIEFPSKKGLENASITPLDLKNNGVVQNALVTKETFSLPFVCPKKDKKTPTGDLIKAVNE